MQYKIQISTVMFLFNIYNNEKQCRLMELIVFICKYAFAYNPVSNDKMQIVVTLPQDKKSGLS